MVYKSTWKSTLAGGQAIANTMHHSANDSFGSDLPSVSEVNSAVVSHFKTAYKAMLASTATLDAVVTRQELAPGTEDVPEEAATSISEAGTLTVTNTHCPPEMCALIRIHTNAAVRSGHGWMFCPPHFSDAQLDTGGLFLVGGGYWIAVLAYAALLDDTLSISLSADAEPAIYSRTRRAQGHDNYYFGIQSATPDRHPHWLRSRSAV